MLERFIWGGSLVSFRCWLGTTSNSWTLDIVCSFATNSTRMSHRTHYTNSEERSYSSTICGTLATVHLTSSNHGIYHLAFARVKNMFSTLFGIYESSIGKQSYNRFVVQNHFTPYYIALLVYMASFLHSGVFQSLPFDF